MRIPNKISAAICAAALIVAGAASSAGAWEKSGRIPGTEIEFSNLEVSKEGVSLRLENTSVSDVRVSLTLYFRDREGNSVGYSIFAVREIPGGGYADVAGNYLSGSLHECRIAHKIEWKRMTYEYLY
jgi:hypothetical protein